MDSCAARNETRHKSGNLVVRLVARKWLLKDSRQTRPTKNPIQSQGYLVEPGGVEPPTS